MKNAGSVFVFAACMAIVLGSMLFMMNGQSRNGRSPTVESRVITTYYTHEVTESRTSQAATVTAAPEKTEPVTAAETTLPPETTTERPYINLNTADITELCRLSGIGEVTAGRIVEYREANGGFNNIEEIMLVSGIGEKTFEAIRDMIYVDDPVYPEPADEETEEVDEQVTEPPTELPPETTEPPSETVPETTRGLTLEDVAPIDLNTATAEELVLLPHVNEEIAESILDLRRKIGKFSHPYELLYVEELEQNQVAEILEFVFVGQ